MSAVQSFLLALIIIFAVPWLVWRFLGLERFAPLAIVQIVGGVVLGPGVLGHIVPQFHAAVFNPATITALGGIANWAVMIFVFLAGVELDLASAWNNKRDAGITAALALILPFIFGGSFMMFLLAQNSNWIGTSGTTAQVVLGAGMACAVTALPILVLLMQELGILNTSFGQRIMRYASLDDVAIWGVLAAILLEWNRLGTQLLFLAGFALAAVLYRRFMPRFNENERWPIALIWLAAVALAADAAGLHFMVGAFLAGVITEKKWFDQTRFEYLRQSVLMLLMPIFFLSTGLRTRFDVGGIAVVLAAIGFLVASVTGKLLGVQVAAHLLNWRAGEAKIAGWLLQTKALIMIIFVNVLLDKAIISSNLFTALLLMAVISTALTTPIVRPKLMAQAGLG
jgi:Kef-type K+ transport system membrane component KefB